MLLKGKCKNLANHSPLNIDVLKLILCGLNNYVFEGLQCRGRRRDESDCFAMSCYMFDPEIK